MEGSMKVTKSLGIMFGLALILAACAPQPWTPQAEFANSASDGQMSLRWNCLFEPPGLVVQGFVNNILMTPLRNTQISVNGINAEGVQVSSGVDNSIPLNLDTNDRTPFEIKVQTTGTEVTFNLWYTYRVGGPSLRGGNTQRNLRNNACPGVPR
jgi:hypothetical protein